MSKTRQVNIAPAKGRPMLTWVGKRPLRAIPALPAQHVETFDPSEDLDRKKPNNTWAEWPEPYPKGGLLFHGDNKEVLAHLLANGFRGKIHLIYIDPPFDSGADYVRKVQLRGVKGLAKMDGETYTLGEQVQYTDIWANDNYLQFMYERLILMRELLAEEGFTLVQCDHRKNHHLRCILDEVFGNDNFRNEIASRRGTTSVQAQFQDIDTLIPAYYTTLLYSKSTDSKLPLLRRNRVITQPGKWDTLWRNHDRPTMRYELCGITPQEGQWRWSEARGKRAEANYAYYEKNYAKKMHLDAYILDHSNATGEVLDMVRLGPEGTVQCYIAPQAERLANNVWMDFPHLGSSSEYPTEKSEKMLERVIQWACNEGDIVFDSFLGSGTTAAVAQKLGRRWIGCDINKGAVQTTSKRLQSIIHSQIKEEKRPKQNHLAGIEPDESRQPEPAQLGFTVWRVNDYDLQIQHNEAVHLACEYIGIERKRSDAYFDGALGKKLAKIIPFNHPLSPLDLEELKKELKARPDEDRDIVLVCLGIELAAQSWLEDWNRLRGAGVPNKVEVIELRTDPKYAGFIQHDPASARVSIKREGQSIQIVIEDFISPTIIKRLDMEQSLFKAKIADWRSQVDCIMIDAAYDGQVFRVALSDVPARKDDLVVGTYSLPAPEASATVAVKIVDMLGEEVLIVRDV